MLVEFFQFLNTQKFTSINLPGKFFPLEDSSVSSPLLLGLLSANASSDKIA